MAEEIRRIITVDTKNSDKSIRDLKNEIKGLQKELEQTAVGSDEFNSALKKLTQTQKSYNEIQQQVRQMSRTGQQDMVRFASFAQNLGKAYSALNAAVGLFANGNEDVQKAMLKVQRTIQLVQGLEGITGLIRDLPKVAAGFRSWLNSLSPIDRTVDRIAKGINGISPQKLKAINDANRGGGSAAAAAAGGGGGVRVDVAAENKAIERQTQILAANGKAAENAGAQFAKLNSTMQRYTDLLEEYQDVDFNAGLSDEERTKKLKELDTEIKETEKALEQERTTIEWTNTSRKEAIEIIGKQREMLEGQIAGITELNVKQSEWYKSTQRQIDLLNEQEKNLQLSTKAAKTLGSTLKQAFSFVWFNLVVAAIVAAGAALIKYLSNLKNAAKEQRILNKAISEGTNQIASKQIVVLKELAYGYQRLGDSAEDKQKFIEQYKDKIKETGIAIEDVKKAEDVFVNNTDKYVDAMMKRAKAQAVENQAVKIYEEYLNKRYELEDKANNVTAGGNATYYAGRLVGLPKGTDAYNKALEDYRNAIEKQRQKILDEIKKLDEDTEERLRKMFEDIADLNYEYGGVLGGGASASASAGTKKLEDTIKQDLEALIQYYKEAEQVLSDEMVNAKQAIMDKYAERIALAEKYGKDTIALELAREKELADLEKQFAENQANEEYQRIQTHIEQIRRMYDTANLREPTEQRYQTTYQQPWMEGLFFDDSILRKLGVPGFATGTNWINVYQSREDVENQLKAQVEYNDQFYLLTKQRIEQENELLKQQLEIEGLSADQRMEIQRTLSENMIALSDAQLQNEQANLQAYLDAQEKRRQALNGVLDVTSTLTGALASMARMEAENAEEGSKKQKIATGAYKAFAITQAIVDTYKGANEAYTAMASIPYVGPALGIAAAAAAIASGIANVMAIKRESISSSSTTTSGSSVSAPSALNTPPIDYTRNLIGDKELDSLNQPIKCYVLESDIRNVSNKVTVTEQNASF